MKKPKILLYDVEVSPALGYFWGGGWKHKIDIIEVVEDFQLLSIAYKWYGEPKIYCFTREGQATDKQLAKHLADRLEEADISIAHNGDSFDHQIARTRLAKYRLGTLRPRSSIDTKVVAAKHFRFTGNSLDDLLRFFGHPRKMKHSGLSLWLTCISNNFKGTRESWDEMAKYNKSDVAGLALVYDDLRPHIENHPNVYRLLNPHGKALGVCPTCQSTSAIKRGFRATAKSVQQDWQCNDCGRRFLTKVEK